MKMHHTHYAHGTRFLILLLLFPGRTAAGFTGDIVTDFSTRTAANFADHVEST